MTWEGCSVEVVEADGRQSCCAALSLNTNSNSGLWPPVSTSPSVPRAPLTRQGRKGFGPVSEGPQAIRMQWED